MAKKSPYSQVAKVIDYKNVFGSEEGKRVLYDILKISGMLVSSYDENLNTMAYREGQRNLALTIFHKLKVDVKQLTKFIEEQKELE